MDDIPRQAKTLNAEGFNNAQLARRRFEVSILKERYPSLPDTWLDMVWNFVERTPKETVDRIMTTGEWEKPPVTPHEHGGIVKDGVTVDSE